MLYENKEIEILKLTVLTLFEIRIKIKENDYPWRWGLSSMHKKVYWGVIMYMYKEGNNRPSSVIQMSLVHNHDKAGNECYTRENPSVRIGAAEE